MSWLRGADRLGRVGWSVSGFGGGGTWKGGNCGFGGGELGFGELTVRMEGVRRRVGRIDWVD